MPLHLTYVEPFFGGGQFLFFKPPSGFEIISDKNSNLMYFWKVVRDNSEQLIEFLEDIEYKQSSFDWARKEDEKHFIGLAAQVFTKYRQSIGGRGESWAKPSKSRTRRGKPDNIAAWETAIGLIRENSERLKNAIIFNGDYEAALSMYDTSDTFFYLDPPYVPKTRKSPNVYKFEMTQEDHERMLDEVRCSRAKILISGYQNDLYDEKLSNWNRLDIPMKNHAAGGNKKREMIESFWTNY